MTTTTTETTAADTGTEAAAETTNGETATTAETTTEPSVETTAGETPEAKAARLESENARLRRENASDRVSAKEQAAEDAKNELLATLTKALGGQADGETPTVEQLTQQLTEQTSKTEQTAAAHRDTQAELIVWRNAADLQVDASALTDSRAFAAAIQNLDPTDDSFAEDVKKAAQEAVEKNPKLKAVQAAGKSGAEITGGSGEGAVTQDQFNKMNGAERNALARRDPNLYNRLSGRA